MARSFSSKQLPNTFDELVVLLGNRQSRKLGNNTYAERIDGDTIGIKLHSTYVVTLYRDGSVKLDSGGWHTTITKDRINAFLPYPFALTQEKHAWYIDQHFHATNGEGRCRLRYAEFSDGMYLQSRVTA